MSDDLMRKDGADALWRDLRTLTAARIGLARTGASIATGPLLDFKLAHARARDAVHEDLDAERLRSELSVSRLPVLIVDSAATARRDYLMRPDLGRQLSAQAEAALAPYAGRFDVALVIADGLSARAVQSHAEPVLAALLPVLQGQGLSVAPLVIVRHARVAIGDAIARALGASSVAVLIGERPGLSAPDSMGAYLTWQPKPETTDADRNCISNIRPEGIGTADASFRIAHLMRAMRSRRVSGVGLKDESDRLMGDGRPEP